MPNVAIHVAPWVLGVCALAVVVVTAIQAWAATITAAASHAEIGGGGLVQTVDGEGAGEIGFKPSARA